MSVAYRSGTNKTGKYDSSRINLASRLIFFFIATTIFFPKLDLGFAAVYIFESLFLLLLLTQPVGRLFKAPTLIEQSYLAYALLALGSCFVGMLITNFFDWEALLLLVKYLSYLLLIPMLRVNSGFVSENLVRRVLYFQYLFIFLASGYVFYNMAFNPVSLGEMVWGYSPEYRLLGLSGQAWGLSGLNHIGNTSVQMGVHLAFLLLLSVSLLVHTGERKYALMIVATFIGIMLTYSRSGLLAAFIGLAYMLLEKRTAKLLVKFLAPTLIAIAGAIFYFDVWDLLSSFGVFGKLIESSGVQDGSAQQRIVYVQTGINYLFEHPYYLLFGTGFGEEYTFLQIGTPHLESLIFTTLFQVGLLGVALLVLHFIAIWIFAAKNYTKTDSSLIRGVLYGYKVYIPGFFLANVVGGNSLQTDFMAPFFYGTLGCCIVMVSAWKKRKICLI